MAPMGLNDLMDCINALKERLQSHYAVLHENETRTRMALIDPLLRVLGWDVSDPAMVLPEYKVNGGFADYALLLPDGKPAAVIEAKRFGESLAAHRVQMVTYATMAGIGYAGLTNGNHWLLYDILKPGQLDEKQMLNVTLAVEPAHAVALKLLILWRSNMASGQPVPASEPIMGADSPVAAGAQVEPFSATPSEPAN